VVDGRSVAVTWTAFVDGRRKGLVVSSPAGVRFETERESVGGGGGGCVWAATGESADVEANEIAKMSSIAESPSSSSSTHGSRL